MCGADIRVNLTPISQMGTENFARRMTGAESLNDDQKKQIREQQEVCLWQIAMGELSLGLNIHHTTVVFHVN